MQRFVFSLLLALTMLALVVAPVSGAGPDEGAEVELIIDYLNRQQVTVIIPSGLSPEPLVQLISSVVNSPLELQDNWTEDDKTAVWLYSAPHLIRGVGFRKTALWDFAALADTAAEMGLSDGANLFLVVNQPRGALCYETIVSDQGAGLAPAASDEMEVWWGFGLRRGGRAPKLAVLLWLRPLFNRLTLAPVWVPLLGMLLLWLACSQWQLATCQRASAIICWLLTWAAVLLAHLAEWPATISFFFGSTTGFYTQTSLLLATFLPFASSNLLLRLPLHRRLAKERRQPWSVRRYLNDHWRLLVGSALLLALGSVWFSLVRSWYQGGPWLAIGGGLSALSLLFWLLLELGPILSFGARPGRDFGAEAMIRSLSGRLRIMPPELHFVPATRLRQANAFAAGLIRPHIYITELLWESLTQDEQQFILAHELAHIKRRDSHRLLALFLLPVWLISVSLILLLLVDAPWVLRAATSLLLVAIAYTLGIALPYRQRMELAADALALQATGDLAASLSALGRVQGINRDAAIADQQLTHPQVDLRLTALRNTKGEE